MEDARFWSHFFGQFKDLNNWIKALIILTPFANITICFALWLHYRERRMSRIIIAKDTQEIDGQTDQDNFKENQLNPTEQLIFDALKRISNLPQGDTTLQIAAPHQKGES